MTNSVPDSYSDLSHDQKALAHYLVEEGELDDLSRKDQENKLYLAYLSDQPNYIETILTNSSVEEPEEQHG